MSLANSSALSCVATAVGCAITGIAVSEQLSQANPEQPIDNSIHQSHPKLAEFMAKAQGSAPVTPPGTLPIEGMSATPQTSDLGDLDRSSVEDLPNPVSSSKSTLLSLRLPEMPQSVAARISQLEEQLKFLPDYLNFDTEDDPEFADITDTESSEAIESKVIELESLEATAIRYTPEEQAVKPVPALPPLPPEPQIETQAVAAQYIAAQYIVEPEAVVTDRSVEANGSDLKTRQRSPQSDVAQYIVDPQEITTAVPPNPEVKRMQSQVQSQDSLRSIASPITDSYGNFQKPSQSLVPDSVHQATLPSTVALAPATPTETKPMPSLLKKLVESNVSSSDDLRSDVMNDIKETQSAPVPSGSVTFDSPQSKANQGVNSLDSVPTPRFEQRVEENQPKSEPVFSGVNSDITHLNGTNSPPLQPIPVAPTAQ